MNGYFQVQVAIDLPLSTTFSYFSEQKIAVGTRVKVPFRNREVCGVVISEEQSAMLDKSKIKKVISVFDELVELPQNYLDLVHFCSNYYHYPIGQTLFTAMPTLLRRPVPVLPNDDRAWTLSEHGLKQENPAKNQRMRNVLWDKLKTSALDKKQVLSISRQAIKWCSSWEEAGYLKRVDGIFNLNVVSTHKLNQEQQSAVDSVIFTKFSAYLLNGITGSGKTEVYLSLIEKILLSGKQALVLVPEINLTPQLLSRFRNKFPQTRMSILHSNIANVARFHAWYAALLGHSSIVIGTRLAVFTPMKNLGLIIVDEEHDYSFKQQDELRYHARDLAVWRANNLKIPIVLGSATPSLESIANVQSKRYQELLLIKRANKAAALPNIKLLDIRQERLQNGLSQMVIKELSSTLARGEQSLVYINRRGFAPVLSCLSCGWLSSCKHCSVRLVVHLQQKKMRCHHCGYEEQINMVCPDCGSPDLQPLGQGTQRIEQTLVELLPNARLLRVDKDSVSGKQGWDNIYQQVNDGDVDILIGTQMMAKGHDFPNISLVVVLNADGGLYSSDFRASERLFAQLTQVAGRAGRADKPGKVLVQTSLPDHPLYKAFQRHDIYGFLAELLKERNDLNLPPFKFQALLRADSVILTAALDFLSNVRDLLVLPKEVEMFGPVSASMQRLAKRERAQLVIESDSRRYLHKFLDALLPELNLLQKTHRNVRWSLDVDPLEF